MNKILLITALLIPLVSFAKEPKPVKNRAPANETTCKPPAQFYRAFVIAAVNDIKRDSATLISPNGSDVEQINCGTNYFSTIETDSDGRGVRILFPFTDNKECQTAFAKIKNATTNTPYVVVIDKECKAQLAY